MMTHCLTKKELDEQFEQFLKESVSDESLDFGGSQPDPKTHQKTTPKTVPWWENDEASSSTNGELAKKRFLKAKKSQRESEQEVSGSMTFRKSLGTSQPIQEEDEGPGLACLKDDGPESGFLFKHTLDTEESLSGLALTLTNVGSDTREEEEEKAKFFAKLEAEASSTIDYSKLNRELDSTSSTNVREVEEAVDNNDASQTKARVSESSRESPGSPHYSEDFDDEEVKFPTEMAPISPNLPKVPLYDSFDNTVGEGKRSDTPLDKAQSYVQSGASEMDALQEAYRQLHVVECSADSYLSLDEGGGGGGGRSSRPGTLSSSQQAAHTHKPSSTNDSELPTAEELMRPIRADDDRMRGFTLQPVCPLTEKKLHSPERINQADDLEFQSKLPEKFGPTLVKSGACGTTGPASTFSTAPPDWDLTWSIREEVERLMKEQNKTPSYNSKAKKQQALHGSSPSSSVKKPSVCSVRGRGVDIRQTQTAASTTPGTNRGKNRSTFPPPGPPPQPQSKSKVVKSRDKARSPDSPVRVSSELISSVQSLVDVLSQQTHTSRSPHEGCPPISSQEPCPHINNEAEELRVQLDQKEKELQDMKEAIEELSSLRKEKFVLQSKFDTFQLKNVEEAMNQRLKGAADPAAQEKIHQLQKDLQEQETLIKGYQQESEKLYLQTKAQQVQSKANEEAFFHENQRLLNELSSTKEQLKKSFSAVGKVCTMDHPKRITDLLAQLTTHQRKEDELCEETHILKREKQALEVELQLMKKDRDLSRAQATSSSVLMQQEKPLMITNQPGVSGDELHELQQKHRAEVEVLEKKLQMFAPNRDADRLKAATAEIQQLKEQVEKLKHEVSRRRNMGDQAVGTKKMQDLQRRVKELEHILKSRNPNSLPALIYAAASASDAAPSSGITELLESRVQRLEAELESHDEEAKRSLSAMEQQFHRIKLCYEQQISQLEQQLEETASGSEPWKSKVQELEEELQAVKQSHQEKEMHLQQQLKLKNSGPGRYQRQAEEAVHVQKERLNQELLSKTRSIQELSRTVERLQRERRDTPQDPGRTTALPPVTVEGETFPSAQWEKAYHPTIFTGSHISEVVQENEALKLQQLQTEQETQALRAEAEEAKKELHRLEKRFAEQLSSLKADHVRTLDGLRAAHALEHSSSKVAELSCKVSSQEVVIKHLQEQLRDLQGSEDALVVSRNREEALQKQLTRLLQDLKKAKDAQSPQGKQLNILEEKILNMELRHQHRETELQQVVQSMWQESGANQQLVLEHWKRVAQDKSREVEAFRLELDSILDIIRHLQRQGVVLPASS
ncbi:centrosomal protein of 162 kDa isoform X2 [Gouania willdenowi]|uniref:centrosomal protein of 162 kDa isoform X2 n=1 Tax=Gouania willdenowi TaxID=441366 RepID=UPI001056B2CF|nr:centrosomal protein of 162 kDa isoform X2 [Gouania willdenowi]